MNQPDCVFCKIVRREIPATFVHETDEVVAFADLHPKAETHLLIAPKRHVEHVGTASGEDRALLGSLLIAARDIATEQGLEGFKLVVNNGTAAGQSVPHLHVHLLAGQFTPNALSSL